MRKLQLFLSLRKVVSDKLRVRHICLSLDSDYLLSLKMKVWRCLNTNIKCNYNVASFAKYVRLK